MSDEETIGELHDRLPKNEWVNLPEYGVRVKAFDPVTERDETPELDEFLAKVREQEAVDDAEYQRVHGNCLTRYAKLIGRAAEARNERDIARTAMHRATRERRDALQELESARTELEQLRGAENERDSIAVDYAQAQLDLNALRAALQRANRALLSHLVPGDPDSDPDNQKDTHA